MKAAYFSCFDEFSCNLASYLWCQPQSLCRYSLHRLIAWSKGLFSFSYFFCLSSIVLLFMMLFRCLNLCSASWVYFCCFLCYTYLSWSAKLYFSALFCSTLFVFCLNLLLFWSYLSNCMLLCLSLCHCFCSPLIVLFFTFFFQRVWYDLDVNWTHTGQ